MDAYQAAPTRAEQLGRLAPYADANRQRRVCPPGVTRGAQTQTGLGAPQPGVIQPGNVGRPEVGLDWLRMTGPAYIRRQAEQLLRSWFGDEAEGAKGFMFYGERLDWPNGAKLLWDHNNSDTMAVELPGGALSEMTAQARIDLMRELHGLGLKPTRLDIAVDWWWSNLELARKALEGALAGEVMGIGSRSHDHIESHRNGSTAGLTCYLGTRGQNGGGKCVRVYDKGLEQRHVTLPDGRGHVFEEGQWERWELEASDDVAVKIMQLLVAAGDGWPLEAAAIALNVSEFREANGRRERARRPLIEWYQRLVESLSMVRVNAERTKSSLSKWSAYTRRCWAPKVKKLAQLARCEMAEVLELLLGDVDVEWSTRDKRDPVLADFRKYLEEGGADPPWMERLIA